jgi:hypothetical protein
MHSVDDLGYRFNIQTLSLDSAQKGGAPKVVALEFPDRAGVLQYLLRQTTWFSRQGVAP